MRSAPQRILTAAALLGAAALLNARGGAEADSVGPLPGGGFRLPVGWILRPAGAQVPLDTLPMSAALSPDGKFLLALNGGYRPPSISVIDLAAAREIQRVPVADAWLGLAFTPDGRTVYVGGGSTASVFEFSFSPGGRLAPARTFVLVPEARRTHQDFIGDVALPPGGRLLYAASLFRDRILVVNPQSGRVIEEFATGRRPHSILFHPGGKSLFVSNWADGTVMQLEAEGGRRIATLRAGAHPAGMLWRDGKAATEADEQPEWTARLFVAAANTNSVYVFGETPGKGLELAETLNVALTPRHPVGMTPSALAMSEDRRRLFVVCSDANAVAVADVTEERSRLEGFLPVGWYPLAARALPGGRLAVLNGHGDGRLDTGTLSLIEPFDEERLEAYTRTVAENTPYRDRLLGQSPGGLPGIEHVVYILLDNGLDEAAPNYGKLLSEYVRFDNFHAIGAAAADGLHWATAAIATDYVQKLAPNSAAGRRKHADYEGGDPAATPPAGYLWTNAAARGITMRNYGHFAVNKARAGEDGVQVEMVRDPVLRGVTNMRYRGPDPAYSDLDRAKVYLSDLEEFERAGHMPRLTLLRLNGAAGGDAALGLIAGAIARSRFWAGTAVFVQPVHASGKSRASALILSPYTRRGAGDPAMYNTVSMLRTIGLILGLAPMTVFDAAAQPMTAAFQVRDSRTQP